MVRRNLEKAKRERDEIVRAALAFCREPEIQEEYESLKGTESASAPATFLRLYEAVWDYRYPAQATLRKYLAKHRKRETGKREHPANL